MKKLILTPRAKWCYAFSAALLVCSVALCLLRFDRLGAGLAIVGVCFAFGVARVNNHLATR